MESERTTAGLHSMTGRKGKDNGRTTRHWIVHEILPTVALQYVGVGVVSTGFRECIAIQEVMLGVF
jgi:hypothetical protein